MKYVGYMSTRVRPDFRIAFSRWRSDIISPQSNLLLLVALVVDLLTPFLIWKGILPSPARWLSHAAVATMVGIACVRMIAFDYIPGVVWVIAGISAIGMTVALLEGQGIIPTVWGWWEMFEFPLVGLYVYLQPHWPKRFPQRFRTFCMAVLGIEVVVQIGQYLTGQTIGDNLAGTFGWHGVGPLVMFVLFVLCLALGQWLGHGQWKAMLGALVLGIVSSVLGEMKLFPVAALALSTLAAAFFTARSGQPWKLVPHVVLLGVVLWSFVTGYNMFVPTAERRPFEQVFLDTDTRDTYLGHVKRSSANVRTYDIGRNFALEYGWKTIRSDPTAFLFGFGLGARSESRTLGTAGVALKRGNLGVTRGTSLLVMMQEMGLLGMVVMGGFILWVMGALLGDIRRYPQSDAVGLRYAVLLFTLLWPLWLWYKLIWDFRVPMLLYWGTLGYVLGESQRRIRSVRLPRPSNLPLQRTVRRPGNGL